MKHELLSSFDQSWKDFSKAWKKARAKASEKAIHGLRVSTRRLIATLELTRALSKHDEIPKLQRRFKKVLKSMGPLRDVQVQLATVAHMRKTGLMPEFKRTLERREERKIEKIRDHLKQGTRRRLTGEVKEVRSEFVRLHEKLGDDRIHRSVESLLKSRRKEFLKARKRFQPTNEETLHEMRIALKKLRYAVEASQPVLGNSAKDRAKEMQAFQQLLGDTRDVELLRAELEKWAAKRGKKIAIVPALDSLQEKRESLMRKIIESSAALDEVLPDKHLKPKALAETTQALEPSSHPPANGGVHDAEELSAAGKGRLTTADNG